MKGYIKEDPKKEKGIPEDSSLCAPYGK